MSKLSKRGIGSTILLASTLVVVAAHAQEAPAAEPATDAADVDIVRLKNGGLLRGKISELVPGGTVTIVTITGDVRVLQMRDVDYAGPLARDPQAAPAQPPPAAVPPPAPVRQSTRGVTVIAPEALVRFRAPEENITFYRRAGSAHAEISGGSVFAKGYERICTAPCAAVMPAGRETFAFGPEDKDPKDLEPVTLQSGESEARLSFKDHSGARIAGWLLLLGGPLIGSTIFYLDLKRAARCHGEPCESDDLAYQISSLSAFGIGLGVGIPLVRMKDTPVLDVSPADAAFRRPATAANGLTLSGQF